MGLWRDFPPGPKEATIQAWELLFPARCAAVVIKVDQEELELLKLLPSSFHM